jgi:periplasmic divalent cation tolerance protein
VKEYIAIFVTCSSKNEAKKIVKNLLNSKLVACANIFEGVKSFFWWKGKVHKAIEAFIIIKTVKRNFPIVRKRIKEIHSYEVPEIIALPIVEGEKNYLGWISESTKR